MRGNDCGPEPRIESGLVAGRGPCAGRGLVVVVQPAGGVKAGTRCDGRDACGQNRVLGGRGAVLPEGDGVSDVWTAVTAAGAAFATGRSAEVWTTTFDTPPVVGRRGGQCRRCRSVAVVAAVRAGRRVGLTRAMMVNCGFTPAAELRAVGPG